ncbi:MAG TPA: tRNA epoxyqueuosine(34) reductase QueG [Bacteroidales bacterium]|nr:tRNA epoxyqueuosine(34) reductase QueG [Bacteroidales bacterium]
MTTASDKSYSLLIKEKAYELGFDLCGIAPSKNLKEHEPIIRDWCSSGMNGEMNYLGQNIEKRINPELLFTSAKSVIVTGLNYYTARKQEGVGIPIISRYAYGDDYHGVIKEKLNKILDYIKHIIPDAEGKYFVDSAPVLEKTWAQQAGLGWPGRHSILINNKIGSFFFLGVIILNLKLDYDQPLIEDHCNECRLCIESCPTGAINENRTIDVRKCISYLTVEKKGPVPEDFVQKLGRRIFGCDKCQEVCPWNKNAKQHNTPEFELRDETKCMSSKEWLNLSSNQFSRLFKGTAIERRKFVPFMRNVTNVTNSKI